MKYLNYSYHDPPLSLRDYQHLTILTSILLQQGNNFSRMPAHITVTGTNNVSFKHARSTWVYAEKPGLSTGDEPVNIMTPLP